MRGVDDDAHEAARQRSGNRDGEDPACEQKTNSLPVDGPDPAVAETDTDGRAGDTHGGGDGELVLGEYEDGDGCAEFHGAAWRTLLAQSPGCVVKGSTYLGWENGR